MRKLSRDFNSKIIDSNLNKIRCQTACKLNRKVASKSDCEVMIGKYKYFTE